ncbi:unnamed protein product [Phytomonas sp. EM1]|nr:unnamed protein product [Phytomonas sp. EM1]|eukprot:CCW60088.1 unnamed protein product [Phytomonas sp. isolate EM1]
MLDTVPMRHNLSHSDNDSQLASATTHKSRFEYQRISNYTPKHFTEVSTVVLITSLSSSVSLIPLRFPSSTVLDTRLSAPFLPQRPASRDAKSGRAKLNFPIIQSRSQTGATKTIKNALDDNALAPLRCSATSRLRRRCAIDHFYSVEVSSLIAQRPANGIRVHFQALLCEARSALLAISPAKACLFDIFTEPIVRGTSFRQGPFPSKRAGCAERRDDAHSSEAASKPLIRNTGRRAGDLLGGFNPFPPITTLSLGEDLNPADPSGGPILDESLPDAPLTVEERLLYVILRTSLFDHADLNHDGGAAADGLQPPRSFDPLTQMNGKQNHPLGDLSTHGAFPSPTFSRFTSSGGDHWNLEAITGVAQLRCFVGGDRDHALDSPGGGVRSLNPPPRFP